MTIYVDIVLLENLCMNYIILFSTAYILKLKIKHLRIFLASLIGAIYSVLSYISKLAIFSNLFIKILLSIAMVYIAFNPPKIKTLGKQLLLFYLTSFLFGGVAFSLIYIIKPQEILMKDGLFLGTYPLKTVFLGAIIASIILITALSILIGSSIANIKLKKNGLINGAIIGGIYMLIIYLISTILNWKFGLNLQSIIMMVVGVIFGILGGILGVNNMFGKK